MFLNLELAMNLPSDLVHMGIFIQGIWVGPGILISSKFLGDATAANP